MKAYAVQMLDIVPAPLPANGQSPLGGRREDFDDRNTAQSFATAEKDNWSMVTVYKINNDGELEKIMRYENGRLL